MNEIKIGNNIHYYKDPNSGFWINPSATNPMDATLIESEVIMQLEGTIQQGKELILKIQNRINEITKVVEDIKNGQN